MGEVLAAVIPSAVMCAIFIAVIRTLIKGTRATRAEESVHRSDGGS